MKYKQLGRTGLLVSELCFGTMTFGGKGFWKAIGQLPQDAADNLVAQVLDAGINFIDTADVYSEGESEKILGKALGNRRKDVVLATKVLGPMGPAPNEVGLSRRHILQSVEESLTRLGTDYIDLYQIHGFDPLTPMEETLRTLDNLVGSGKVRYIGCSNLAAWQIMKSLWVSDTYNLHRFESLQAYYTIAGRDLEREIVPVLEDQKLGLMVWSPLAGGLLSGKYDRDGRGPDGARRVDFDFPPVNKDRAFDVVDVMREIARDKVASVAQIALSWLLHQPVVTSVIIGAKTPEQLAENLAAPEVTLTDDELARLKSVSDLPAEYPGWMLERQAAYRFPEPLADE
ncbi:aldo/keto reductase [Desulfosarcina ovata subsp. sediminis]|uniref:Aldo/keto reductase n=1 Tax=Desulfosarcina ovata subsp. sediminis TaxID=885957 RepID=A0A5K7ZVQ1_9BACT|nr:aldo/keto reductase [Desulfosarcina ovata]BBO84236.1 aldo/keto reductase [Desulfosarcina ovata subsp. sediminis]